jgi:D-glycero-D-manno-heptose 1,7-bisphosphate phosphatase
MASNRSKAVFLDRDGTLIRDVGYLRRMEQLEILPGVPAALRVLRQHGFKLVVVSNQSAVARGWLSEKDLRKIHDALNAALAQSGVQLDGIYYCPHHPTEGNGVYRMHCRCRKPDIGMIERASAELGLVPEDSYVVGDQRTDLELAARIGAIAILVRGNGSAMAAGATLGAIVPDLWQAARWIIEHDQCTEKKGVV